MGLPRFARNDKKVGGDKPRPYERIKLPENREKTLTRWGDVIYSIRQLKGRRKVSKVPGLERTVRIRQCMGGGYPRLIFDSPFVIARLASFLAYASEQAPHPQRLPRFARNDNSLLSLRGAEGDEAISVGTRGLPRFACNDKKCRGLKVP